MGGALKLIAMAPPKFSLRTLVLKFGYGHYGDCIWGELATPIPLPEFAILTEVSYPQSCEAY